MCDCLCSLHPDGTLFAKSSDRPPGEAQVIEAYPPRSAGGALATQYLSIPDEGAPAILGAHPSWLWGFEHGLNEARVAIGNEQLWTVDDPSIQPEAFTGMDLVRLGLERAGTAAEAVTVITDLIERMGQGGVGDRDEDKAYFSSFLVADPTEAWALETSARSWAARRIGPADRGWALSNRISLAQDWTRASTDVVEAGDFDRWRRATSPTAHADKRLAVTRPTATAATSAREVAAVLRHHGERAWGRPGAELTDVAELPPAVIDRLGTGVSLCMHLSGVQATTSSIITWLPRDPTAIVRSWIAPGNPCVSVFVPGFGVDGIAAELGDPATWERFRRLRERVETARAVDGDGGLGPLSEIRAVLGPIEADLWAEADAMAAAAAEGGSGSGSGADAGAEARAWARQLWPRIDRALVALRV